MRRFWLGSAVVVLFLTLARPARAEFGMNLPLSDRASRFPFAIGISGAVSGSGGGPGMGVDLWLSLRGLPVVMPEIGLRESFVGGLPRIGAPPEPDSPVHGHSQIEVGARFLPTRTAWAPMFRVAWNHTHRESWVTASQHFGASVFGVAEEIDHRTGFTVGAGVEFPRMLDRQGRRGRFRGFATVDFNLTWGHHGGAPLPVVLVSAGTWIGVGKRPQPVARRRSNRSW